MRYPTLALVLSLIAASASAQDRLFIGTGEIGAFGRFGERIGDAPGPVHGQLIAGGRYVASGSAAFDTQSGEFIPVSGGTVVGVDPRRPRVFVYDGTTLSSFDLESRAVTALAPVERPEPLGPPVAMVRLAPDTDELFVLRRLPRGFIAAGEFAIIDLRTRAVTRTVPFASPGAFQIITDWHVTSDGHRMAVLTFSMLTLIDSFTGSITAQQVLGAAGDGGIVDDRRNRRLYVRHQRLLSAFDDDLRLLGAVPLRSNCAHSSVAFSHHTGRIYVVESEGGSQFFGIPIPITFHLSALDAETGQRLDSRDITRAAGVPAGSNLCSALPLTLVTAPGVPAGLSGSVSGHDVSLSWTNVGDASNFVLDVGLAPGRTDLTFSVGAASPVTLANAPSGTYYLRVRGTNAFGVSRPSSEVTVVVP